MVAERMDQFARWWDRMDPVVVTCALLLPVFVWVLRGVTASYATGLVALAASKIGIEIYWDVRQNAKPAAAALSVALALFLSLQLLGLPGVLASWAEVVARVVVVFCIFWLIDSFVQCALAYKNSTTSNANVIQKSWLPQFLRLLLVTLMMVAILKNWGIDLGPALTGLGIAGAAVAFAAQDFLRNVIGGVTIAGENRFREGDWVNFGQGTDGIVEKLQLRSTVIPKFDRSVIHVPNAELANQQLINFTTRDRRRLRWEIGVPFGTENTTLEAICRKLSEFLVASDHFVSDSMSKQYVTLYAIETAWLTLLVDCFVSENSWEAELAARKALAVEVIKVFEETGADFALPTQTVFAQLVPRADE